MILPPTHVSVRALFPNVLKFYWYKVNANNITIQRAPTFGNLELSQSHLATHLFNWISILTSFWVHTTPKSWLLYFRKTTQLYMLYNAPQGFNPRSLADLWYLMMNKPAIPWRPTSGNTFLPPEQLLGITALQSNVYKTVKRVHDDLFPIINHKKVFMIFETKIQLTF